MRSATYFCFVTYCKDGKRQMKYTNTQFDFLGYTFKARKVRSSKGGFFIGFNPAVSKTAIKEMRSTIIRWKLKYRVDIDIKEIAKMCNPVFRGWLNYYGKFSPSSLEPVWCLFNMVLTRWAQRKYKKINSKTKAANMIQSIIEKKPWLFVYWKLATGKSFV